MPLKRAKGPYAVSTLTLELPARNPRAFQPEHYKINGQPAFHLTTILVTIFYPTDRSAQAVKSKRKPTSAAERIKGSAANAAQQHADRGEEQEEEEQQKQQQQQQQEAAAREHDNSPPSSGSKSSKTKAPTPMHWLNTPRLRSLEGLLKFAGLPKWVALPVILPAYRAFHARLPFETNAPLSTSIPRTDEQDGEAQFSPLVNLLMAQDRERRGAPPSSAGERKPVFPCAVFSHGLGGTRVTYSAYCAALASHGVVVAAIEHRDGTAPATTICSMVNDEGQHVSTPVDDKQARYWEESLIWLSMKDLDPDEKVDPKDFLSARKAQLLLRRAEFLEALSVLRRLNKGEGEQIEKECLRTHYAKKTVGATPKRDASKSSVRQKQRDGIIVEVGAKSALDLKTWTGRLDIENAWALGHSFGAATAIEVMRCASTPPSLELGVSDAGEGRPTAEHTTLLHPTHDEVVEAQAFKHALVLDPWTEPIEAPGKAQKLTRPLFVINSEAFSVWQKNFDPLRRLVEEAAESNRTGEGWLMSLYFSDYPFLLKRMIGSDVKASECNRVFAGLSLLQIAARASTSKLSTRANGPSGGEQAQEGAGGRGTSVSEDVIASALEPTTRMNGSTQAASDEDGAYSSFWTGVDALMNANGNELYRASDKEKAQYPGCVKTTRLRVEWEAETDQSRLGRPVRRDALANGNDAMGASQQSTKKHDVDRDYGNERPGILIIHPLGTPGSCPRRLVGHGLHGAATLDDQGATAPP
ncbi:hypothetical protein OC835_005362 [Tilletia horrida]|nr:hypothetical protein OC835_005362 [Tilletia horrida]